MITVTVDDVQADFSNLLIRVINGEQVVISKAGKPIAMLTPIGQTTTQRVPGNDAGKVVIKDNFDDPLPEFDL
jgi:prevent-host-death family protein